MRESYNDLRFFNITNNEWTQPRCYGDIVEARRNHASFLLSKLLFIFGGVGSTGKQINDIMMLNLETLKWSTMEVENPQDFAFT